MKFPDAGGGKGSSGGGGGTFLKLKDGDRIKGVFRGDPAIFRQHFIKADMKSYLCPGKADCSHCKAGDKSKFRFRLNFLTQEDNVWVAKVFEQGYGTYLELKEMHESEYDLPSSCVILSRSGEGTDTRYRVTPAKNNGGMTPADFKKLDAIPLNDLTGNGVAPEEAGEREPGSDG